MRWIPVLLVLLTFPALPACSRGGDENKDLVLSYVAIADLCAGLDMAPYRVFVPEIATMQNKASNFGGIDQMTCDFEGAERFEKGANRTIEITVDAYVFADGEAMDEWNSGLPDQTDCTLTARPAERRNLPDLGAKAVGYTCDHDSRDIHTIQYLMRVDDANLRIDIQTMIMVVGGLSVPANDDVAAASRRIAESTVASLRKR